MTNVTGAHVVIAGCGNIGSHLVPHLARMSGVSRLTLIDKDDYEPKNTLSQDISVEDLGKPKAEAQARRVQMINRYPEVEAIVGYLQDIPLATLRGDVIIGCLDNNAARRYLNDASWHLNGIPYIDGGVRGEDLLARISVYRPGKHAPCLECSWDDRDYARKGAIHPCGLDAPTNSPSALGALVAALAAIECRKILDGQWERTIAGKQLLVDMSNHRHYLTAFPHNPDCRFAHDIWQIERLTMAPDDISIGDIMALGEGASRSIHGAVLRYEGVGGFLTRLRCHRCENSETFLYLARRLSQAQTTCRKCGREMTAAGFDTTDTVEEATLRPQDLEQSLGSLGFKPRDVFTVSSPSGERHFEIGTGC
jgi:molybdopterin/thiamine biosynthesis adenylyltransferase